MVTTHEPERSPSSHSANDEGFRWLGPLAALLPKRWRERPPLVPVVRLSGAIGVPSALRPSLNLGAVSGALDRAFSMRGAKAVAIVVNSPGGSPVQSMLIHKRIRALAQEKELPVYVFVEDVAASGGYMLALAGDEIIADPSSIVGSIGVIYAGFGFHRALEKLGVERRVHTAGARKLMLDPFRPEKPEDVERLHALQAEVHETFVDLVQARRGTVLGEDDETLFSGEFWTGRRALELGLIDGLGDLRTHMRARFGSKVRFKLVERAKGLWPLRGQRFMAPSAAPALFGASDVLATVEERALWARFGL
jgi:signal peptide peptidase SppA